MTLRKVLFIGITFLVFFSCSKNDIETYNNLPGSEIKLKKSRNVYPETYTHSYYGMPFDDQYIGEDRLIKIVYRSNNDEVKTDVRRKFYRKYPDLILVKLADYRSPVEYWFLKIKAGQSSGGIQQNPEEDEELTGEGMLYSIIINDIRNDELIDLYYNENHY